MKRLCGLLLLAMLAACSPPPPAVELRLEQFLGQWVVINYWATWCKPCIKEIPELNALDDFPQVAVLGVNYDGASGEELRQQLLALGITFPTLDADPAAELGVARPLVLPTTLVLDPTGQLHTTLVGPQTLASLAAATGQVPGGENRPDPAD